MVVGRKSNHACMPISITPHFKDFGLLASRLENRVQLSSDGLRAYVDAVEHSFGADVDYAQIVKSYEAEPIGPGRYSPPKVTALDKTVIQGRPDWDKDFDRLRGAAESHDAHVHETLHEAHQRL